MLCLAVTRLIELIGEAASQYPKELQMQYPQIPWAKMISMRNRLIHGYDFVDYNILWNAVTMNIPRLLVGERYFDQATGHSVAVMEVDLYGKRREVMVAYVIEEGCARMLTVHPLKGNEKENRVRSGRWRKV